MTIDTIAFWGPSPPLSGDRINVSAIVKIISACIRTRIPNAVKSGIDPVSNHQSGLRRE